MLVSPKDRLSGSRWFDSLCLPFPFPHVLFVSASPCQQHHLLYKDPNRFKCHWGFAHVLAVIGGGQPCLSSTQSPSHSSGKQIFHEEHSHWPAHPARPTPRVLLPGSDPVGPVQGRRGREPSHETGQPGGNRPAGSLARASTPAPNNDASSLDNRHHLSELWLMLLHQPLVAHRHLCWSGLGNFHGIPCNGTLLEGEAEAFGLDDPWTSKQTPWPF